MVTVQRRGGVDSLRKQFMKATRQLVNRRRTEGRILTGTKQELE
jgi:hypothetical protein